MRLLVSDSLLLAMFASLATLSTLLPQTCYRRFLFSIELCVLGGSPWVSTHCVYG